MGFLFIPAGTLKWPEAWLYLVIQFSFSGALSVWLMKNDPALLEKRMSHKMPIKLWDKLIALAFIIFFIVLFLVMGFDAVRYQWSQILFIPKMFGFFGIIISMYIVFLTMKENTYLTPIVEIQKDRGHKVITTGPYKYVRHPMYVGIIISLFSISFALGSLYGLIPGTLMAVTFIIRTHFEDITLHEELPGYVEYAQKTRYRLLPGVW